jgi:protein SCO1/2
MPLSVDELIERIRAAPAGHGGTERLVSMLRQDAREFRGLSAGEADRVRGHVLAAFEHRALPADAIRAVKEEVRTSLSPIVLAGAARAMRAIAGVDAECRALLVAASERIEIRDELVRLDAPAATPRTARAEIAATLAGWEQAASHCCHAAAKPLSRPDVAQPVSLCPDALSRIAVEDQSERRAPLLDLLRDRTSLIAFFYTRCMNPAKCSLTISRLGDVARLAAAHVGAARLNFLGISYDPDFDAPARLYAFGKDRGFPFGDNARLMRCTAGWAGTRRMFDLQVGYGGATVNAHARELFVVSSGLRAVGIDCERLAEPALCLEQVSAATSAG